MNRLLTKTNDPTKPDDNSKMHLFNAPETNFTKISIDSPHNLVEPDEIPHDALFEKEVVEEPTKSVEVKRHFCKLCQTVYASASSLSNHRKRFHAINSNQHRSYSCAMCQFSTDRKNNFDVHLQSGKHKRRTEESRFAAPCVVIRHAVAPPVEGSTGSSVPMLCPNCGLHFTTRAGLWKHKQKCVVPKQHPVDTQVLHQMTQLIDLKPMLVEQQLFDLLKVVAAEIAPDALRKFETENSEKLPQGEEGAGGRQAAIKG